MKTIRLYGELGVLFGREFQLDVKTPAEAMRALSSQVKGFREYFQRHAQDAFKVFVGARNASEEICGACSDKEIIRVTPVATGSGAVVRIILGVVICVLNFFFGGNNPYVYAFAASLIFGGVSELLTSKSNTKSTGESSSNTPSYNFNGPVNTSAQGNPVPLCYGRLIVGSAVISAGITTL